MSQWLNQVNDLLEKLDHRVEETVVAPPNPPHYHHHQHQTEQEHHHQPNQQQQQQQPSSRLLLSYLAAAAVAAVGAGDDSDNSSYDSEDNSYESEEYNDEGGVENFNMEQPDERHGKEFNDTDENNSDISIQNRTPQQQQQQHITMDSHAPVVAIVDAEAVGMGGGALEESLPLFSVSQNNTVDSSSSAQPPVAASAAVAGFLEATARDGGSVGVEASQESRLETSAVSEELVAGEAVAASVVLHSSPSITTTSANPALVDSLLPGEQKNNSATVQRLQNQHQREIQSLTEQLQRAHNAATTAIAAAVAQSTARWQKEKLEWDRQTQSTHQQEREVTAAVRRELLAVQKELHQAAETVEQERAAARLDRDELLFEQEEELHDLKQNYESQFEQLRIEMQKNKIQWQGQLKATQHERNQLDNDMTVECDDLKHREQEALQTITTLQQRVEQLEQQVEECTKQESETLEQSNDTVDRLRTAESALATMEERFENAVNQHKKQLQQRLARETQLEQAVAELSIAAATGSTVCGETALPVPTIHNREQLDFDSAISADDRSNYQTLSAELEAKQMEHVAVQEHCHALERELSDLSRERQVEAVSARNLQHEYDARWLTLSQAHQQLLEKCKNFEKLDVAINSSSNRNGESQEFLESKGQVANLSEQLMKQQDIGEMQKSEILALKGRLQVAMTRADTAERHQQQQQRLSLEIESGENEQSAVNEKYTKRRIKGGRMAARMGQLSNRSKTIRGAIGWNLLPPRGGGLSDVLKQHLGHSIDAIDSLILETSTIFRHEPLARLGFAAYFAILHLWCFAVILFHTIEAEHGELGYITNHRQSSM